MEPPPKPGNKIVIRRRTRGMRSEDSALTGSSTASSSAAERTLNSPRRHENTFVGLPRHDTSLDRFKILLAN